MFSKLRARWKLAGWLADAEANGATLIDIPAELRSQVMQLRWSHNVAKAAARWEAKVNDIPLADWQAATQPPPVQTAPARRPRLALYNYEPIPDAQLPEYIEWSEPVHDPVMFGTVAYGRPIVADVTPLRPPEYGCPWMALTWDITGDTRFYQLVE